MIKLMNPCIQPQTHGPLTPREVLHMKALATTAAATTTDVIEAEDKGEGAQ